MKKYSIYLKSRGEEIELEALSFLEEKSFVNFYGDKEKVASYPTEDILSIKRV